MKTYSTDYKLIVYVIVTTLVLLQTIAYAVANPGLVNQLEVEPHGFDVQISEAGCMRLLEKIDMDEELREKAILRVMSSESILVGQVLRLCNAYYDDTKLLVRRLIQLLLTNGQKSKTSCVSEWVVDSYGRKSCKNELGQTVFTALPVSRGVWHELYADGNIVCCGNLEAAGDYVDVNGDGILDFVVSYSGDKPHPLYPYYRATFVNDGNYHWIMVSCEADLDWTNPMWFTRFPSCK